MKKFKGRAMKYGDNINTDIISPPACMELPIHEAAKYTMSVIDEEFSSKVRKGDIFVAENNLGSGSSRETAPLMLKELGVKVIVAKSFARIFYRNCINLGLVALECNMTEQIEYGDKVEIDCCEGTITNLTKKEIYNCSRIPEHLMEMIETGGLYEQLKKAVAK